MGSATILRSQEDKSINFISPTPDKGAIEARFVQRTDDTIIIYLSSATGCNKACRFCHLTQMKQTMMTDVTIDGYLKQAKEVMALLIKEKKLSGVRTVHFNFMARGDALANIHFINHRDILINDLVRLAESNGLIPKFKISTIFPSDGLFGKGKRDLKLWVLNTLEMHPGVEFYYSLYSLDPAFRKRWIPKSIDPDLIGEVFYGTINKVRIHHALIEGENTSEEDIDAIKNWLFKYGITTCINIVRYNPFSSASGKEPDEKAILAYANKMKECDYINDVQIVSRVGRDVYASCGTFHNGKE